MNEFMPHILGGVIALAATLFGLLIRRLYKSIDLLFNRYDALRDDTEKLKLAMVAVDPSRTVLLKAFMGQNHE